MAGKYYSGKFKPTNIGKYQGAYDCITYRSLWERQVFRWCDMNTNVIKWSSEEIIVPYLCKSDGKYHRYYVDLLITFSNGKTYLIEIKPKSQTIPPKKPARQSKKFLTEVMTYVKNQSKWHAAEIFANQRGWEFQVWTEDNLTNFGIKLILERAPKPKKKI